LLDRQVIRLGSIVWAVVGFTVALRSIGAVDADARVLVLTACVVRSASAVMASAAVNSRHERLAGVLLVVSVITPTFFSWVLNVPALVVGAMLIFAPAVVTDRRRLLARG
jgi:hypothetical protein